MNGLAMSSDCQSGTEMGSQAPHVTCFVQVENVAIWVHASTDLGLGPDQALTSANDLAFAGVTFLERVIADETSGQ